jgi:serine/threonine-protein kinase RsbW
VHRNPAVKIGELLSRQAMTVRDVGPIRRLLTRWARGEDLDADTVHAITLSGYEAVVNSIEHGYHEQDGGVVELYADHTDDRVTVTVVDHGHWQTPTGRPERGRGLVLIRGLSDHTTVTSSDNGTTVTMTWRV